MTSVRICELRIGDVFEIGMVRHKVAGILGGRIYYRLIKRGNSKWTGTVSSMGERSQLFVNLISRKNEQDHGVVKSGEGSDAGPGAGDGSPKVATDDR
jgi:hypothetical protein